MSLWLSAKELSKLVLEDENDFIEKCESPNDSDKIAKTICAFANDLGNRKKPSVLFIGLKDNGEGAGLSVTDQMLLNIANIRSHGNLQPFPAIDVKKHKFTIPVKDSKTEEKDCELIVVQVAPSKNPPMRYKGACWIRVGPSIRSASEEEENRLSAKRRAFDLPKDMEGVSGSDRQSDLSLQYFKETYLPSAVSQDTLLENNRDIEKQMQSLRLLDSKGLPTMTALLIMGKNPRYWFPEAYIQFIRFDGSKLTDPVKDQKVISGTLPDQITQLETLLKTHISTALKLSDKQNIQSPDYPLTALSQISRNAIIHRDYTIYNPIKVYWFNDRIEIHSPGAPYGEINQENFGQEGLTSYRNPSLAEALKNLGFVEKFGFGIAQSRESLKENGNPELDFKVQSTNVLSIIKPAQ